MLLSRFNLNLLDRFIFELDTVLNYFQNMPAGRDPFPFPRLQNDEDFVGNRDQPVIYCFFYISTWNNSMPLLNSLMYGTLSTRPYIFQNKLLDPIKKYAKNQSIFSN